VAAGFGAAAGFGVWLLVRALLARPVPLDELGALLERRGRSVVDEPRVSELGVRARMGAVGVRLVEAVGFVDVASLEAKLRVLDKTLASHCYEKLLGAVAGFLVPTLSLSVVWAMGLEVPPAVILVASLAGAAGGFFYPDLPLNEQVAERRREFRYSLSGYLDLVAVLIAGSTDVKQAMWDSAETGGGWAFAELRGALQRARNTGRSTWQVLDELGEELGIEELQSLARAVTLSINEGAELKTTLTDRADALRQKLEHDAETTAESNTERMVVPVVVMVFALVMFIGFAAVNSITSSSTTRPAAVPTTVRR